MWLPLFSFSLDPEEDPLGILLMIDFYALRSEQFSFLIRLFEEWEVWISDFMEQSLFVQF